jgi:hypothetical protein
MGCLDGRSSIPGRASFSLLHNVQAGSGAQPASYQMSTEDEFPGRAHQPSIEVKNGGAIPRLFHTSSRRATQLIEHRDNFTFTSGAQTEARWPDPGRNSFCFDPVDSITTWSIIFVTFYYSKTGIYGKK